MRNGLRIAISIAAILLLVLPALAYTDSLGDHYEGPYCTWDGVGEHYDDGYWTDYAGGATGVQTHTSNCDDGARVKVRWRERDGICHLDYFPEVPLDPIWGVNSGQQQTAEELDYTDHDVLRNGTWYGFRIDHDICF